MNQQLHEIVGRLLASSDLHWLAPHDLGSTSNDRLWRIVQLSILNELSEHVSEDEQIKKIVIRLNEENATPLNLHPGWRIVKRSILKELTDALDS